MTDFKHRVTIICPEQYIEDANHLSMVYGYSEADSKTFNKTPSYEDSSGNLYSVSSAVVTDAFMQNSEETPVRPIWDQDSQVIDMDAAIRAYSILQIYDPENPVQASPSKLLSIIYPNAQEALKFAGVSRIITEDELNI